MHPLFDARFMTGTKPLVLGGYALAVLSTMSLGALEFESPDDPLQEPRSSWDRSGAVMRSTLNQTLSDLRRASIAELEKAAEGQAWKLEPQSLLVTSCEEGGLLAGAAVSGAGGAAHSSDDGDSASEPAAASKERSASADGEVVGVVVIVHSSPTGGAAGTSETPLDPKAENVVPADAGAETTADMVPNGTYHLRRNAGASALELVGPDGRIAATIPLHGEAASPDRSHASEREDDERGTFPAHEPLAEPIGARSPDSSAARAASDWPDIYMAILHWLDPRFRS